MTDQAGNRDDGNEDFFKVHMRDLTIQEEAVSTEVPSISQLSFLNVKHLKTLVKKNPTI